MSAKMMREASESSRILNGTTANGSISVMAAGLALASVIKMTTKRVVAVVVVAAVRAVAEEARDYRERA